MTLKPDTAFEPDRLRKAVHRAGFEVRDMQVTLRGILETHDGDYVLKPDGMPSMKVRPAGKEMEPWLGQQVQATGKVTGWKEPIEIGLEEIGPPK